MDANTLLREISSRFAERLDSEVLIDGSPISSVEYSEDDNTVRINGEPALIDNGEPEGFMEAEGPDPEAESVDSSEVLDNPDVSSEILDNPDELEDYEELDEDEMQRIAEALNDADNGENS